MPKGKNEKHIFIERMKKYRRNGKNPKAEKLAQAKMGDDNRMCALSVFAIYPVPAAAGSCSFGRRAGRWDLHSYE